MGSYGTSMKTILQNLEIIEQTVRFKKESVLISLEIWESLSGATSSSISNYLDVFPRAVKTIGRTIFSAPWFSSLNQENGPILNSYVERVRAILCDLDYTAQVAQCQKVLQLLEFKNDIWSYPVLSEVINAQSEEPFNPDSLAVTQLWDLEGWTFLESRIESLCASGAEPGPVLRLAEIFLYKGKQLLGLDSPNPSSFDLTQEKFLGVASLIAVFLTYKTLIDELEESLDSLFQIFKSHLTFPLWKQLIDLLFSLHNQKFPITSCLPNWKPWKYRSESAFNLLDYFMRHIAEIPEAHQGFWSFDELKSLFFKWIELSLLKAREERKGNNQASGTHDDLKIDDIFPSDKVKVTLKSIKKDEWAFELAQSLRQLYPDSKCVLYNCVEIYIQRLEPGVISLTGFRDVGDQDGEIGISKSLASLFLALSNLIQGSPQVSFEILLTVFSLDPTKENLDALCSLYESNSQTIQINERLTRTHNALISLPDELYMALGGVIDIARVSRLGTFRENWKVLKERLLKHHDTRGKDIKTVNQLELAKPTDFTIFKDLGPAFDEDEEGWEKGYFPKIGPDPDEELEAEEEQETLDKNGKKKRKAKKKKELKEPRYRLRQLLKSKQLVSTTGTGVTGSKSIRKNVLTAGNNNRASVPKRKYVRKMMLSMAVERSKIKRKSPNDSSAGAVAGAIPSPRKRARLSIMNNQSNWPPREVTSFRQEHQSENYYQFYPTVPSQLPFPRFCQNGGPSWDKFKYRNSGFPSTYSSVCRPRLQTITNTDLIGISSKCRYSSTFDFNAPFEAPPSVFSDDPNDWLHLDLKYIQKPSSENTKVKDSKLIPNSSSNPTPNVGTSKPTTNSSNIKLKHERELKFDPFPTIPELPLTNGAKSKGETKEPVILLNDISKRIIYPGKHNPLAPPQPPPIDIELKLFDKKAVLELDDISNEIHLQEKKLKFSYRRQGRKAPQMSPFYSYGLRKGISGLNQQSRLIKPEAFKKTYEHDVVGLLCFCQDTSVHPAKFCPSLSVVECMNNLVDQTSNSQLFHFNYDPLHKPMITPHPDHSQLIKAKLDLQSQIKNVKRRQEEGQELQLRIPPPPPHTTGAKFKPGPVYNTLKKSIQFKKPLVSLPTINSAIDQRLFRITLRKLN